MPNNSSAHHLDVQAQQLGFPDYATWAAWNAKRSANLKKPQDYTTAPNGAPKNWLQQLMTNLPPFSIIGRVNDAYGKATGQ